MASTFTIKRINLKRAMAIAGISEKNSEVVFASLNRMHRHVNAVAFAGMLQKSGAKRKDIENILRRIGIDDVSITSIFNTLDEEKIKSTFGKVVELSVDM